MTIDPTFGATTDTWVDSQLKTSQQSSKELRVGSYDAGKRKSRSYVKFNTSSLKGGKVVDAKLRMFNYYSSTCKAGQVIEAKRVTSSWDSAKITWDKQPSTTTSNMGTNTQALGYSSACKGGLVDFNMTKIVEAWTTGGQANHGLQIRAKDESASTAWRRYRSANYVEGKQDNKTEPHLVVTWNRTPNVPTSPKILGSVTSGGSTFTGDARPTFESTVKDPDGGTVKFDIEVKKDSGSGANAGKCTSGYAASGKTVKCKLDTDLADNATYVVRTRSWDGKINSAWSGWTPFKTALAVPAKPTLACPAPYTKGSWHDEAPKSDVECTITATGSGNAAPNRVEVDIDHKRSTIPLASGKATFKVSRKAGSHRIDARAYTVAGKASPWAGVYTFGYGRAGLTSPTDGTTSTSTVQLESSAPPKGAASSVTAKVFWRLAGSGEDDRSGWTESNSVPVKDNGDAGVSVSGLWNTQSATQTVDGVKLDPRKPTLLDVQVCYIFTGVSTQCSWATNQVQVVRIAHAFGNNFPTSDAGLGQVALWTGEFNTSVTDVSVPGFNGDLSLSRTHSTYAGATDGVRSIFGPGWTANLDGDDEAGLAGMEAFDATRSEGIIALIDEEGDPLVFQQPSKKRIQMEQGVYTPVDEDTKASGIGLRVEGSGTSAKLLVTDDDGVVTTFTPVTVAANKDTVWTPASVASPGKQGTTTFTKNAQGKITRVLAGSAPGVKCPATGALKKGCRALEISYASSTTATKDKSGDVAGQVKQLSYTGWDPETKTMATIPVAEYLYDGAKRLQKVTDPRSGLSTSYTYTAVKNAIHPALGSVTPAGEKPWYLHYGEVGSSTKLTKVSRAPLGDSGSPVTLASYVYEIDPLKNVDGLPNMSADGVSAWGQTEAPSHGFAVFSADEPTPGGSASGISRGQWSSADLSFTDDSGYVINTASYGAGDWLPTRTLYDDKGNTIAEWDTAGLDAAKSAMSETNSGFDATYYATVTRYNADSEEKNGDQPVVPAGSVVTDVWEPVSSVVLPNGETVEARKHVRTDYDQGAPNGGLKPGDDDALKQKFLLPTTVTTGAASADSASTDTEVSVPKDLATISTAKSGYDPIDSASPTDASSGWMLGIATTETTVVDGGDDIVSKTRFDAAGGVVETRQPRSNGKDAGTTLTSYYTADGSGQCVKKPEWAGLLCETRAAGAPSSGPAIPTVTKNSYSVWLSPASEAESSGAATRTTETTYLDDGRTDTVSVSVDGLETKSLPATKTIYDASTGKATGTQSIDSGTAKGSTSSEYDAWGRQVAYTNAQGERTTTEYVRPGSPGAGEVAKTISPVSTVSYGYDGTDVDGKEERRGLLTSQTVSGVGDFAASYDSGGKLIRQTMPGGVEQASAYDINGNMTSLSYAGAITLEDESTEVQPWLSWSMDSDVLDRTVRVRTPDGRSYADDDATSDLEYSYDQAGRLVKAIDRTGASSPAATDSGENDDSAGAVVEDPAGSGSCALRSYEFDQNSNRTKKSAQVASPGQDCGKGEKTDQSWNVDAADRVTGGYSYDALGRVTTLPAADAPKPGAGDVLLGYYADDLPASISQGQTATEFFLDPEGRRSKATTTNAQTTTVTERHYADASDNPAWVVEAPGGESSTTRYESSIGGDLGITVGGDRAAIAVVNPHGDNVSSIVLPDSERLAAGVESWASFDEYGVEHARSTSADTGALEYGWLGGKERAADDSGLILMGVRLYNPVSSRFTAVDPEEGGSPSAYAYPTDPVNSFDLDGKRWNWKRTARKVGKWAWRNKWDIALTAAGFIPGVGAIAWGFRIYRVVRAASQGVKSIKASRVTARAAGRIWTRSIYKKGMSKSGKQRNYYGKGRRSNHGYRSASKKGKHFGSNLTYSSKGRHDYTNLHVVHRTPRKYR